MSEPKYKLIIRPLSTEEGGGYLAEFPDLPGCMADGETPEEARHQAEDALKSWLATAKEFGDFIPEPAASRA
jgi:antitoxin HicB